MKSKMMSVMACVLLITAQAFAVQYTVTDLNVAVGGNVYIYPKDVLDDGRVACEYTKVDALYPDNGTNGALVSAMGSVTRLGIPSGSDNQQMWYVKGVSGNGYVVGYTAHSLGIYWHNGLIKAASPINAAYPNTTLKGVNNSGYSVGNGQYDEEFVTGSGWVARMHAVAYDGEVIVDMNSFLGTPERSYANGINNQSVMTGDIYKDGVWSSYTYGINSGIFTALPMITGATSSGARAINDLGQVIGWSGNETVLWENNKIVQLGKLSGDAYSNVWDINSSGMVVGDSYNETVNDTKAVIWTAEAGMQNLNSLIQGSWNGTLFSAQGINDLGQIAAVGYSADGLQHGYLLTPVPEPAVWVSLTVMFVLFILAFCKPTHIYCSFVRWREKK